jgi:uncharacterized protein (TIGR02246 family)
VLLVATSAIADESVETAIKNRVRQYEAAYNTCDVDGMAAIYKLDGSHTYALGFTHHGREEIAKGLREQLEGPAKGTQMSVTPLVIRSLTDDVAVEEGSFILSGLRDLAGTILPPFHGLCLVVYQKIEGQWFIAAAQCMVPPPAAPAEGDR